MEYQRTSRRLDTLIKDALKAEDIETALKEGTVTAELLTSHIQSQAEQMWNAAVQEIEAASVAGNQLNQAEIKVEEEFSRLQDGFPLTTSGAWMVFLNSTSRALLP